MFFTAKKQYFVPTDQTFHVQGLLYWFVILWKPKWPTKTVHWVKIGACVCSLGRGICLLTFGMDFKLNGWPPQPPTFSSISTKITKKCTISNLSFDMLEAVVAILQV